MSHDPIDEDLIALQAELESARASQHLAVQLKLKAQEEIRQLRAENERLQKALNQCGDNLCHLSEQDIVRMKAGRQIPPWSEFGESCRRFHAQMVEHCGGVLAGSMTIAQLEAEVERSRNEATALRVHFQSLVKELNVDIQRLKDERVGREERAMGLSYAVEKLEKANEELRADLRQREEDDGSVV